MNGICCQVKSEKVTGLDKCLSAAALLSFVLVLVLLLFLMQLTIPFTWVFMSRILDEEITVKKKN